MDNKMPNKVIDVIKINPDNTVNIKPIKDSWSREEVVELLNKTLRPFLSYVRESDKDKWINKWIEENL